MTNVQQLNGILNRIGNFDPVDFQGDFDKRLVLQKTVYLLQAFGLNTGFRYSWYIRGPYSSDLTKLAYSVATNYDSNHFTKFREIQDEKRFCEFLRFLGNKKNDEVWLETVASIHFLAKLYGEKNVELIFSEVQKKMRNLSKQIFFECWNVLWQNGLLTKKIMLEGKDWR